MHANYALRTTSGQYLDGARYSLDPHAVRISRQHLAIGSDWNWRARCHSDRARPTHPNLSETAVRAVHHLRDMADNLVEPHLIHQAQIEQAVVDQRIGRQPETTALAAPIGNAGKQ